MSLIHGLFTVIFSFQIFGGFLYLSVLILNCISLRDNNALNNFNPLKFKELLSFTLLRYRDEKFQTDGSEMISQRLYI